MNKLSVGIDGLNLALPKGTGVATYARTLANTIHKMKYGVDLLYGLDIPCDSPPALREVQFFNNLADEKIVKSSSPFSLGWWRNLQQMKDWRSGEIFLSGRVETRGFESHLPKNDRIINIRNIFKKAHRYYRKTGKFIEIEVKNPPKIMHWTYPLPIKLNQSINIYTLHDLIPLRLPQTTLDNKSSYYNLIKDICSGQGKICTVSESSRNEILSFFPEASGRIHNAYQTYDEDIHNHIKNENFNEVGRIFNIDRDGYFVFFGSLEPKKNIGRLIEAFLASSSSRKLVIVGAMGWKNDKELRFLQHGIDTGRIIHTEYLPRYLLTSLLINARGLLFPSLAEGFGLPALEALVCGTPVICSSEGGLPEVVGDAAMIVDAYDTNSIASGIIKIDRDDTIYNNLKAKGPIQAATYSPDRYADRLKALYQDVLR